MVNAFARYVFCATVDVVFEATIVILILSLSCKSCEVAVAAKYLVG